MEIAFEGKIQLMEIGKLATIVLKAGSFIGLL